MADKESAKAAVRRLLERFQDLPPARIRADYNERNTCQAFILPLFQALGWDTTNPEEVFGEQLAGRGRVDYAFRIDSVSRFYLEAKPLRAELTEHPEWVIQANTYAYSKGIPFFVLTNFKSLWAYSVGDSPRRFITLNAHDYEKEFDALWLLSKESVASGAFEKYAEKVGALPERKPIERHLFERLREWRERLTSELLAYQPDWAKRLDLVDEIIERLFNRLVFIRTCEDRRIEDPVLLPALRAYREGNLKGRSPLLTELRRIFAQFNKTYDSDLFQPHTLDLAFVQDDTLADILEGLHTLPGGQARYDFGYIDADILGRVYEQYLGHVAQVVKQRAQLKLGTTPGRVQVLVEARRQRRKAQGIYYTPKWVVDYIVRETLGRYLRERPYREAQQVRILDPACGSGSFLIRAYDELLQWYAQQCTISKRVEDLDWNQRIAILTKHIFGVDLDARAVDIARLNLLLRALAGRYTLPLLKDNIKQGNSLISGGEEELKPYFGAAWREKHPFNWEREFREVMQAGGFDVVIGNPPWVESKFLPPDEKVYYQNHYDSMTGQYDIFCGFVERGIQLLRNGGILGFIIPNRFLMNPDYGPFRSYLLNVSNILHIRDVGEQVFQYEQGKFIQMPSLIMVIQKEPLEERRKSQSVLVRLDTDWQDRSAFVSYSVLQARFFNEPKKLFTIYQRPGLDALIANVEENGRLLGELVHNARGVEIGKSSPLVKLQKGKRNFVPFIVGEDMDRYTILGERWLQLGVEGVDYKDPSLYTGDKILIRKTGRGIRATIDRNNRYVIQVIYILKPKSRRISLPFILGILNSRLMQLYYHAKFGEQQKKVFPHLRQESLLLLPIRKVNITHLGAKTLQSRIIHLVERMLALQERLVPLRETPCDERDALVREIAQVDRQIDEAVYDLYGLTQEERKLVEEAVPDWPPPYVPQTARDRKGR